MAIYEVDSDRIVTIKETTFAQAGLDERRDLQRLLKNQIEVIAPDTLVISEEFCDWEDSNRRIDLLGLDKDANIVVIELKRTEDGGHMELQAIRYAAMASAMAFDKAIDVYSDYLRKIGSDEDAKDSMLSFLEWDEPDDEVFAQDVRILLVSADFGKELTTAVIWLNERELDIRCIRIKPYDDNGRILIDVQQLIPLPEAEEYQVQIREKAARERGSRRVKSGSEQLYYRFWEGLLDLANKKTDLHSRISPSKGSYIAATSARLMFCYAFGRNGARVELYIDKGDKDKNKNIFDQIASSKEEIEQNFGGSLYWQRLDNKDASRISAAVCSASVRDEEEWPQLQQNMVETMIKFEKALIPHIKRLAEGA
ncbi:MAG: DUF4268 domain-containing protein [Deltaproteobacteria bacterium]|nr:DUF4268 domain-containing protein [Deltaproteobacteria bacterium]